MKKNGKENKGFTLIELLIVVVIIGILAAVAIPAYMTYVFKERLIQKLAFAENQAMAIIESESFVGSPSERIAIVKQMLQAGFSKGEIVDLAKNQQGYIDPESPVFATMIKQKTSQTENTFVLVSDEPTPVVNEVKQVNPAVIKGNYRYETLCSDKQEYLVVYRIVDSNNTIPVGVTQKFKRNWNSNGLEPITCFEDTK